MKIKRFLVPALAALLIIGAGGLVGNHAFAQTATPSQQQAQVATAPDTAAATEDAAVNAPDTDTVEEQVGDQNEVDTVADGAETPDSQEAVQGPDTDTVEEQVGDQNETDTGAEQAEGAEAATSDANDAAPAGTPAITADAARQAAEAHLNAGPASRVQLDDEDGSLVYSVEIGASDVKVDAMTGAVLSVDAGQD